MPINIIIKNKIAVGDGSIIVCGNNDYIIKFTFDEEWAKYNTKTARFKWNGNYVDIVFDGDTCPVPVVNNTYFVVVGVYAGNLHTTTPATFKCEKSILCGEGSPKEPTPDVYNQIMEKLNNLNTDGYEELKEEIGELENLDTQTKENLVAAINEAITQAEQSDKQLSKSIKELEDKIIQSDYEQNDSTKTDYIKNRPFYDATSSTMEQVNITWDGDTTGKVQSSKYGFYKISDRVFTNGELKQMVYTNSYGETDLSTVPDVFFADNFFSCYDSGCVVIRVAGTYSASGCWSNVTFPEAGIYFPDDGRSLTSSQPIEIMTGNLKQLDAKYIPDAHINDLIDVKLGVIENGSY